MLEEEKVYNEIVTGTGASSATVSRVGRSLNYGKNGYRLVIERLRRAAADTSRLL
jgi:TrpR-related protein YerC/YecD